MMQLLKASYRSLRYGRWWIWGQAVRTEQAGHLLCCKPNLLRHVLKVLILVQHPNPGLADFNGNIESIIRQEESGNGVFCHLSLRSTSSPAIIRSRKISLGTETLRRVPILFEVTWIEFSKNFLVYLPLSDGTYLLGRWYSKIDLWGTRGSILKLTLGSLPDCTTYVTPGHKKEAQFRESQPTPPSRSPCHPYTILLLCLHFRFVS